MLEFSCSKCSKKYKAPESSAGKGIKCPCGNTVKIPQPVQEAAPPQEDVIAIQPQEDAVAAQPQGSAVSIQPEGDVIGMQDEPPAAKTEAPPGQPGPPGEVGKDGEWQPMWSKDRFDQQAEERPVTLSWKGIIFLILAVIILPALGIYANYAYKGYLANVAFIDGLNALNDGNKEEALERFKECIEMRPLWSAPYLPAASLAHESGDLEEACYFLRQLADMDNVSYRSLVYNNLAAAAIAQEKPDYGEARSLFENAIKEDSSCPPANLGLALLSYNKDKIKEAKKYIEGMKKGASDLSGEAAGTYTRMQMRVAFAEGDKKAFMSAYAAADAKNQNSTFRREAALMALELLLSQPDVDKTGNMLLFQLARKANTPKREEDDYVVVQTAIAGLLGRAGMHIEQVSELEKIVNPKDAASDFMYMLTRASAAASRSTLDEEKKAEQDKKAFGLYKKLVDNRKFLEAKGRPLIIEAVDFCAGTGRREDAWVLLKKGMDTFSGDAKLHRMAGALYFQERKFKEGIVYFERSLDLDPSQEKLREEVKSYRVPPSFSEFRPSKPGDFVARPVVHIKIESGTRFPIEHKSIKFTLDEKPRKLVMGGSEGFFVPEADLAGGRHVVEFFARDIVGNSGTSRFTFGIDLSGPTAKLIRPGDVTEEPRPLIEIKLADDLSNIDMETLTIVLRSGPDNPDDVSIPIVFRGKYKLEDKTNNIVRGAAVSDEGTVAFRLSKRLSSGEYLITVKMSDTIGNSSKLELRFTVEGELEEPEDKPEEPE